MYYAAWLIIILIFIWRVTAGFKKGLIGEIISLISMIVAGFCLVVILSAVGSYLNAQMGKLLQMILVLFVVCFIYKIVNVLFTSLKLISKLPVIKILNSLLGAVFGAAEAVVIVVILVRLLKYFSISLLP